MVAASLNSIDKIPTSVISPMVTMVFAMVDGGKQFAARQRREGAVVHSRLSAMMRSVLRQVGGVWRCEAWNVLWQ